MTISNTTTASNSNTQLSVERQLAELIDEVRVSVGPQATLAAKISFNPKDTLTKFNNLIEKAISSAKEELDKAIANKSTQAIIDSLNQQLELITERAVTFQHYLNELSSSISITRGANSEQGNALSAWLDEVSPLAEPEDLTEMPFQSLKADRTNIPRDFSAEITTEINIKTRDLKNIDDFFLPEYIASTNETEITEDILAKAKELGNSPVQIYEWVRNNVEWQPTWGGQQTADMTLDVRRGNAMDISTLMIALLRAAKIPARYIHGTVDIPVDNFINMAGDFENVDAAMDFVSAGGIPVTSVTVGGKIAKVRIEHVWVEAAVPFYPSRGSKPVSARNPIDTWTPLDGSYKQYEYLHGIDSFAISNIDSDKFFNNFEASSDSNEQEGWVQGINVNIIEQTKYQAENDLAHHIVALQNSAFSNVIGGRKIIKQKLNMLPGSLPYLAIVRNTSYIQLINDLQIQIKLSLGYDRYTGEYFQQKTWPLYQLSQRNITICFKPATKSDEDALSQLVPNDYTGSNQLPKFIPSTIRTIPQINIDSEVLLVGNTLFMGEEVRIGYELSHPKKIYLNRHYNVIAGSYLALGITGMNISNKTFNNLKASMSDTKRILESGDKSLIGTLTREKILGDMFINGVYDYYAQLALQIKTTSIQNNIAYNSLPTFGTFGYEPHQKTFLGIIRGIESNGLFMNMYTANIVQSKINNYVETKMFMQQIGTLSSVLEHEIPEKIFRDENYPDRNLQGFSAIKALMLAVEEGQRIYELTPDNKDISINSIKHDSYIMIEIKNALASGKHVITHTNSISLQGYKGSGYIIIDPETGAGAFKISGGKNGGALGLSGSENDEFMALLSGLFLGISAGLMSLTIGMAAAATFAVVIGVVMALIFAVAIYNVYVWENAESKCFALGVATTAALLRVGAAVGGLEIKRIIERLFLLMVGAVAGNRFVSIQDCV